MKKLTKQLAAECPSKLVDDFQQKAKDEGSDGAKKLRELAENYLKANSKSIPKRVETLEKNVKTLVDWKKRLTDSP